MRRAHEHEAGAQRAVWPAHRVYSDGLTGEPETAQKLENMYSRRDALIWWARLSRKEVQRWLAALRLPWMKMLAYLRIGHAERQPPHRLDPLTAQGFSPPRAG